MPWTSPARIPADMTIMRKENVFMFFLNPCLNGLYLNRWRGYPIKSFFGLQNLWHFIVNKIISLNNL
jgi:hypothetical protein